MAELNHFAISAGMGATLGPRVGVQHGQIATPGVASAISTLLARRQAFVADLSHQDNVTTKYEKAVAAAYLLVREGFSSDRVLADPRLGAAFVRACHDLGLEDSEFHLNVSLIGLRKHNKLKEKSNRSVVPDQWRCSVASEVAARAMFYRYDASVATVLAHPALSREFDSIARGITPGFSAFQYRWAALNSRKKGTAAKIQPKVIDQLEWSHRLPFDEPSLPTEQGVYTLLENTTCLFVAGTENIQESIAGQRRIAEVPLFEPQIWRPNPARLFWRYIEMPKTKSDYRSGVVRSLVGRWQPIFNIPRGRDAA